MENGQIFSGREWNALIETLSLPLRQGQVVQYIFEGCSDKQIANELDITVPTVRSHIGRVFEKLEVEDRNELMIKVFSTSVFVAMTWMG